MKDSREVFAHFLYTIFFIQRRVCETSLIGMSQHFFNLFIIKWIFNSITTDLWVYAIDFLTSMATMRQVHSRKMFWKNSRVLSYGMTKSVKERNSSRRRLICRAERSRDSVGPRPTFRPRQIKTTAPYKFRVERPKSRLNELDFDRRPLFLISFCQLDAC